jgi:hypothetical protein
VVFNKQIPKFTCQNLFVWSVFLNRLGIAKIFWQFGKHQMLNAMFASMLLRKMAENLTESEKLVSTAE